MPTLTPSTAVGHHPNTVGGLLRTVRLLFPHEVHAARTAPLLVGALLGTAICATVFALLRPSDTNAVVVLLRFAALLGGLGLAFVLDDPAGELTAVCPSPYWLRRLLRITGALTALSAVWWLDIALVTIALPQEVRSTLPLLDLAIESLVIALVAVALTLIGLRSTRGLGGGVLGGGGVVLLAAVLAMLPAEFAFYAQPDDTDGWAESLPRWRVLGVVALATTALLLIRQPSGKR